MEREIEDLKAIVAVYRRHGKLSQAVDVLGTVMRIQCTVYGEHSNQVAKTMCELADILSDLNRHTEARNLYGKAISIWQKNPPFVDDDKFLYTDALVHLQGDLKGMLSFRGHESDDQGDEDAEDAA